MENIFNALMYLRVYLSEIIMARKDNIVRYVPIIDRERQKLK